MRSLISLIVFSMICVLGESQQLPLFTQYREYQSYINPASLNSDYFTHSYNASFGISHRNQWTNFEEAPKTQFLRGEYILESGGPFGLVTGGYIINDQTDPYRLTGFYGRLAGIITDDQEYAGLSIGFSFGMVQYRFKTEGLKLQDQIEAFIQEDLTKISPDVGVGIYFYKTMEKGMFEDDTFYGGFSIPQVFGFKLDFNTPDLNFTQKRVQHYYGHLGWYKYVTNKSFFETVTWIKYVQGAPIHVDLNFRYQFQTHFWLGLGGSTVKSLHLEAGVNLGELLQWDNNLKLGYGYDYAFSTDYGPYFGTSHEINITYVLDMKN